MAADEGNVTTGTLPLPVEAEWERFARHLDLIANEQGEDGFWLAFLVVHSPAVAGILKDRVRARFDARRRAFVELPAETPARLQNVLPRLLGEEVSNAGCVWVQAVARGGMEAPVSEWREAWSQLLLGMNERRDAIRRRLGGGLVLVGPLALKAWAQAAAPDLWSVRTVVLELPEDVPEVEAEVAHGEMSVAKVMESRPTTRLPTSLDDLDAELSDLDAELELRQGFSGKVRRVARLREPDATIRSWPAPAPFEAVLVATRRTGRIVDVAVVAAFSGSVSSSLLQVFLKEIRAPLARESALLRCTLVHGGEAASEELLRQARAEHVVLQPFSEYQSVVDLSRYLRWQTDRLERDPSYPAELYVEQRAEVRNGLDRVITEDALSALHATLLEPSRHLVLVLGDLGTGKTFLLRQLALRMASDPASPAPVLVEMRDLQKSSSLDMLLAEHFARSRGGPIAVEAFRYLLSEGKAALLLDGLDELAARWSHDGVQEQLEAVRQVAGGNARMVVTSRTALFLNERSIELALGRALRHVGGHRRIMLETFDRGRIHRALVKRLGTETAATERERLLDGVEDLMGLSANPRMLAFILDSFTADELREAKARGGKLTRSDMYEWLVTRWLRGEVERARPRGVDAPLSEVQLWRAVTDFALLLWPQSETGLRMQEVPEGPWDRLTALDMERAVDTEEVKNLVGSRSLLVRDDEGRFSFLHPSILEWLVARDAAKELREAGTAVMLARRGMSPLMADFLVDMAGSERIVAWARAALGMSGEAARNGILLLQRVGHGESEHVEREIPPDLSGKDLSWQDFSGSDYLRGADLSRADLGRTTFIGADLSGANLADAWLCGADLRQARLRRSNLSGANLNGADLRKADLTDVNLAKADLSHARLLGAKVSEKALSEALNPWMEGPRAERAIPGVVGLSVRGRTIAFDLSGTSIKWHHGGRELWSLPECRLLSYHAAVARRDDDDEDAHDLQRGASGRSRVTTRPGSVARSADGLFEAELEESTLALWPADDKGEIVRLDRVEATIFTPGFHPSDSHPAAICAAGFHPTHALLVTASSNGVLQLWDLRKLLQSSMHEQAWLAAMVRGEDGWAAFAPDGRYKVQGDVTEVFWHEVGSSTFQPGELDGDLDAFDVPPRRVPLAEPLFEMPDDLRG